jgi:hypothetical protein
MWNKIVNPKTGKKVNVNSKMGKNVLKNYIKQLGGASSRNYISDVAIVPPQEITIDGIRKKIAEESIEYCGIITHDNRYILTHQGKQSSCSISSFKDKYPGEWHLHSHISKYYPSPEDILNVIKNKVIISQVFTGPVYWTIKCDKQWGKLPNFYEGGDIYTGIKQLNDLLYGTTVSLAIDDRNARDTDNTQISVLHEYINVLNTNLSGFGFNITFSFYPQDIEDKYRKKKNYYLSSRTRRYFQIILIYYLKIILYHLKPLQLHKF